ncbi:MAG: MFS transporter [Dehalococcoidia bacterium]|nr:MFS transporter [Dehalococcoidia bacterium]
MTTQPLKPWASFGFGQYRLFWFSSIFGQLGQNMRQFANLIQVHQITGSAGQLGLTGLFQAVPLFLIGPFAGAIADRYDRRKLLMVTMALNMLFAIILAVLSHSGAIKVWHIWTITVLTSCVNVFGQPARQAMIAGLVPRTHLMNAISLNISIGQSSQIFGPSLAGLVLGTTSAATAYYLNAALYVPVLIALAVMKPQVADGAKRQPLTRKDLMEGIQWFFSTKVILGLFVFDAAMNIFGNYRNILPVIQTDVLHISVKQLGILTSAPSIGALIGTLAILSLGNVRRKGWLFIGCTFMYAVFMSFFGLSTMFWLSLILVGFIGMFDSVGMSVRHTTLQTLAPDHLRGRASSVMQVITGGFPALGAALIGFTAEFCQHFGYSPGLALSVGGVCILVIAVPLTIFWKEVRRFES